MEDVEHSLIKINKDTVDNVDNKEINAEYFKKYYIIYYNFFDKFIIYTLQWYFNNNKISIFQKFVNKLFQNHKISNKIHYFYKESNNFLFSFSRTFLISNSWFPKTLSTFGL